MHVPLAAQPCFVIFCLLLGGQGLQLVDLCLIGIVQGLVLFQLDLLGLQLLHHGWIGASQLGNLPGIGLVLGFILLDVQRALRIVQCVDGASKPTRSRYQVE